MSYYLGIDLGSTTCKVIIVDEMENILSRGITNTRSNYKIATQIAEQDAIIMARFLFLRRRLTENIGKETGLTLDLDALLNDLELGFRYQHFMETVASLFDVAREETGRYPEPQRTDIAGALDEVFRSIRDLPLDHFRIAFKDKGIFFRDLVGALFMKSIGSIGNYKVQDKMLEVFDKAIIRVENKLDDIRFKEKIDAVLEEGGWLARHELQGGRLSSILKASVDEAVSEDLTIERRVGTGYGRQRLPFPKSQIQSEILCHGMGAHYLYPSTRTVLDIGGQDTKAIQLDPNGVVNSFVMNDRCAAGCGRFLGYVADELNLGLQELGPLALEAKKSIKISSTCTVFAGVELRDRLSLGERRSDILAGLHRSIVRRAISLVARAGGIRDTFTFTGGVAKNVAVVKEIRTIVKENYGDITINISPDSIFVGALGAALFAKNG